MRRSAESLVRASGAWKKSHTFATRIPAETAHPRTWLGRTWWGQAPAWLHRSGPAATGPSEALARRRSQARSLASSEDRFDRLQELDHVERFLDERCDALELHPLPSRLCTRADDDHRDGCKRVELA